MKLVIAIIHPEQLPAVKQALFDAEVRRFTASTVQGTVPKAEQQTYRGVEHEVSLFNRIRLEIAVNDAFLEPTIEAICSGAAKTGGHGKIFVTELLDIINAWNGERGPRTIA
jgi:nitrogen regulatory protein P-II 1